MNPGNHASSAHKDNTLEKIMITNPRMDQEQLSKINPPAVISMPRAAMAKLINHNRMVAIANVPKFSICTCSGNMSVEIHSTNPEIIRFNNRLMR